MLFLDRLFSLNMASSSSNSPVFARAIVNQDDSIPSPLQIRRQRYQEQIVKSFSPSCHSDDDDEDDNDNDIRTSNDQPSSSVFYEVNGLYFSFIINLS